MSVVPPLVNTKAAAQILGVRVENLDKVDGLPPSLQERDGKHEVTSTRLWTRAEIESLAADRRL